VVNYELPNVAEDYVHRIGRTGRAGQDGTALSLVCVDEHAHLADIEKLLKRQIDQVIVPGYEPDPSIRPEPIKRGGGGNSRGRQNSRHGGNNGGGQRRGRNASAKSAPGKRSRRPSQGNKSSNNRNWRSAA
jgi:ATP-dependent RNA helicase RhlE